VSRGPQPLSGPDLYIYAPDGTPANADPAKVLSPMTIAEIRNRLTALIQKRIYLQVVDGDLKEGTIVSGELAGFHDEAEALSISLRGEGGRTKTLTVVDSQAFKRKPTKETLGIARIFSVIKEGEAPEQGGKDESQTAEKIKPHTAREFDDLVMEILEEGGRPSAFDSRLESVGKAARIKERGNLIHHRSFPDAIATSIETFAARAETRTFADIIPPEKQAAFFKAVYAWLTYPQTLIPDATLEDMFNRASSPDEFTVKGQPYEVSFFIGVFAARHIFPDHAGMSVIQRVDQAAQLVGESLVMPHDRVTGKRAVPWRFA
jgi:hypothetical protein